MSNKTILTLNWLDIHNLRWHKKDALGEKHPNPPIQTDKRNLNITLFTWKWESMIPISILEWFAGGQDVSKLTY